MNKLTDAKHRVYFIQSDSTGLVKIGYSRDLQRRISSIRHAGGSKVRLIRCIEGGPATERWFHKRFADLRVHGEWFRFDEAMLSVVPPDEVPRSPKVVQRRDIRLSLRERVTGAEQLGAEVGLTQKQILLTLAGQLSDEEAQIALDALRSGGAI